MTVSSSSSRISYSGNGTTTAFSFPYEFGDGSDLKVYKDGVLQTITTHYTVSGGSGSSGTVTFVAAPASGLDIVIYDDPPATQLLDYIENDPFPATSHEFGLDKLTRLVRRLRDQLSRTLRLADSDVSGASTLLPEPEAQKMLGWNSDATGLTNYTPADFATVIAYGTANYQEFSGNGVTTDFVLSSSPVNVNNLVLDVSGVLQRNGVDFTLLDSTVTFTTAPPVGVNNIHARWMQALPQGSADISVISFQQAGTGAVTRSLMSKVREFVHLADFGGGPAVANNAAAMQLAITYCLANKMKLILPAGDLVIDGAEFVINAPIVIEGQGRDSTKLIFKGNPPSTVRTYCVWRTEYDSGNYAASSDAALSCAFVITSTQVFFRDFNIQAYWDGSVNHPLPFNSATDYPTSEYDNGVLIQNSDVTLERMLITGPWGLTGKNGGIRVDTSQPGGATEHIKVIDCESYGRWGLVLEGAHGQPAGGANFSDMTSSDTRGSGGWSDFLAIGSQFYDTTGNATSHSVRLTINGVPGQRVRRFATDGGALSIDGQVAFNSAKRAQQATFLRCRFANADYYTMYLNYCNRIEFKGCHTEFRAGYLLTDGVTTVSASDSQGRYSTVNARKILFLGGEKSGEVNNLTYKDTVNGINLVTEIGLDDPAPLSSFPEARMVGGIEWRDRGGWTPVLRGAVADGTPEYSAQNGVYVKFGNMVYVQARITLTNKGGISGAISISGFPYTATNFFGNSDSAMVVAAASNVTTGDAGISILIDNNTKIAQLYKTNSGGASANIGDTDLANDSSFVFSGLYITEEP